MWLGQKKLAEKPLTQPPESYFSLFLQRKATIRIVHVEIGKFIEGPIAPWEVFFTEDPTKAQCLNVSASSSQQSRPSTEPVLNRHVCYSTLYDEMVLLNDIYIYSLHILPLNNGNEYECVPPLVVLWR